MSTDSAFVQAETVVIAALLVVGVLLFVLARLRLRRRDFDVAGALALGLFLRVLAIAGIASTGLESSLRGGDETTFLSLARILASQPVGTGYWPHGQYQLHTILFALEIKIANLSVGAMRIIQVGIAMLGILLIVAAVYDLAGRRAARFCAYVLALEPASIFFNSALHKEPLMELAAGLVAFGATKIWRRLDPLGILLCAGGGLIAVETRSYAGWFLVSASVLVILHAALRNMNRPLVAVPVIYAVAIAMFIATPVILQASSKKSLVVLQTSQTANTAGGSGPQTGANGNNLALERVDFSSRGAILSNLPKRIRDVILKPYPWQLHDSSQRFGAIGTLFAWTMLLMGIAYSWQNRGRILPLAGPLLYPLLFLLIAYSLSAGNAGTSFRYRTHLVTLGLAIVAILRDHARRARSIDPGPAPITARTGSHDAESPRLVPA